MEYPKIVLPRRCFVVTKNAGVSPRVQLARSDHREWLCELRAKAEQGRRYEGKDRFEERRIRMFWRAISFFVDKLCDSSTPIMINSVRGEMSRVRDYCEDAFNAAAKALFKVS